MRAAESAEKKKKKRLVVAAPQAEDEEEPQAEEKEEPAAQEEEPQPEDAAPPQASRGAPRRERTKSVNTVAARMKQVVDRMIASQRGGELRPHTTVFLYKSLQSEIVNAFFIELQKENTALFHDRKAFLRLIAARYDEFAGLSRGSATPAAAAEPPA